MVGEYRPPLGKIHESLNLLRDLVVKAFFI